MFSPRRTSWPTYTPHPCGPAPPGFGHSLALEAPWRMLRVALGSSGARSEFNSPGERWDVCPAEPKNAVLQALRPC